jgi:hypothetical protein
LYLLVYLLEYMKMHGPGNIKGENIFPPLGLKRQAVQTVVSQSTHGMDYILVEMLHVEGIKSIINYTLFLF